MAQDSHTFTFADALARSEDVYEVEFNSWGTRSPFLPPLTADPNLQFPAPGARSLPSSVAVAAIGPRSTVDRCWVTWDRQKTLDVPPIVDSSPNPGTVISSPRILSVGAPLLFPQATRNGTLGPRQSLYDAMQYGLSYVFPYGLPVNNVVNPEASSFAPLIGTFGTTTVLPATYLTMFGVVEPFAVEPPFLHLILYPKLPTFSPPTKRAALQRAGVWQFGAGNAGYVARIPIFGRKHVCVQFVSHLQSGVPGQIATYTVGLVRNVNESLWTTPGTAGTTPVFEVRGGEVINAPANIPVQIVLNNPCADYVTLHITNGVVGPAAGAWTVVAED